MISSILIGLELRNITKAFTGVLANDQISFTVVLCEIYALSGENGPSPVFKKMMDTSWDSENR